MGLSLVQILVLFVALVSLVLLLFSFPDLGKTLEQAPARWTGLPSWHPPIKEFNFEKNEAIDFFATIAMGISSYYSLQWTSPTSSYSLSKPATVLTNSYFYKGGAAFPTTLFDQLIAYYIFSTFIAAVAVIIFDVGKLWSIFGSLHNMLEIAIMLVLHNGGKVKSHFAYFGLLGFYTVLTNLLSVLLDWPYDGIWFKVQGLCSDWAMVIQFTRLYYVTKKNLRDNSQDALPTTLPTDDQEEILLPSSVELNINSEYHFYPNVVDHPRPLILLIIAASIHLGGNITNSVWVDNRYAWYAFGLSYALGYSIYGFYLYLDTHCNGITTPRKRIYLPDTSSFKVLFVVLFSIFLSLTTVRFAVFLNI